MATFLYCQQDILTKIFISALFYQVPRNFAPTLLTSKKSYGQVKIEAVSKKVEK